MIKKSFIRAVIYPALISGIFTEVAHNHHSGPHTTRHERIEELRQRKMQSVLNKTRRSAPPAQGGQIPEPAAPSEETTGRQARRNRQGLTPSV